MADPAKEKPVNSPLWRGLSAKVLALTVVFVMLGEVLIFLPSIANFRIQWLKARITQAEIAALAAEAAPNQNVDERLRTEILKGAGVVAVSLKRGDTRQLILRNPELQMVDASFDLRSGMYFDTAPEALSALFRQDDRLISVTDVPPNMSGDVIEVALHERPMIAAMRQYGLNILFLSVLLSLGVAGLIYTVLNSLLVRPMRRLARNMTAFASQPEDPARLISPGNRKDEIGIAERELRAMQQQLQDMLHQKSRLAALGLAVSKVSHDLRNMLTSAHIMSDALAGVNDPQVQRTAPRLISSLDRAITFLNQTLTFGKAQEPPPQRQQVALHEVVEDVLATARGISRAGGGSALQFENSVPRPLMVDADRDQLHRVLTNLVRNAVQALESQHALGLEADADGQTSRPPAPRVSIRAQRQGSVVQLQVEDTGPGIPEAVRDRLFMAFQSAARPGGTGLGLAIAAELVEAHGGSIRVGATGPMGTVFEVAIPDRPLSLEARKQAMRQA